MGSEIDGGFQDSCIPDSVLPGPTVSRETWCNIQNPNVEERGSVCAGMADLHGSDIGSLG